MKQSHLETAKFRVQLGTLGFISAILITFMDMYSTYSANDSLVNVLYITSATLIGVGLVKQINK